MDPYESRSNADQARDDDPRSIRSEAAEGTGRSGKARPRAGRLVAAGLGAGLVAGLASWGVGEATFNAFRPPLQKHEMMGQVIMKARFEDQSVADSRNATLTFGALGALLGLALGAGGGLASGSARAGARASAVGLVLGSLLGSGASLGLLPLFFRALDRAQENLSHDLTLPLMVHAGIWAACGLAAGAAFGIGLGGGRDRILKTALGGLVGAAMGAALYEMIGAAVFHGDKTSYPLSMSWGSRLLARMLVCTMTGLIAAAVVDMQGRRPAAPVAGS